MKCTRKWSTGTVLCACVLLFSYQSYVLTIFLSNLFKCFLLVFDVLKNMNEFLKMTNEIFLYL